MYDPPIEPCSRCAGIDVVSDTAAGDIVCRSCGEIQASRIIDYSAEWREFAEDDRGKNGSAARSSCIADKFGSSGTEFAGGVSESARAALVKAQMQVTDKRELKIGKTAVLISNIGSTLHLTRRIMDCAYDLSGRAIMEEEYAKLKRNEILAAAVISLACRLEGYPRTLQEISNATNLDIHVISKAQTAIARDLKISTGRVSPQDLVGRIISNPLIRMTDPVTIQYAKDLCRIASEEGVLDGQQPQVSAAASIIFIGTIRSFLEKKKSNNLNNSVNLNMKYFGKVLRSEKADVNIALTAETAMASIKAVKKAYHILLVNIDTVVPKDLLDRILHQILMTDGKHWSYDLPTFDELAKNQKNEASRGEKEMGIIRQRDREKEKEKESDRELKKIATEKSSKLGNKSEVTVIPHLLDGETIKDDRDVKLEKSASTLLFQCCPALSLAANINQKFQETNLNAKNIAINQYMVKSERVRTDSPNIKAEHSQNRAEYKPMMSCSLTMKEEKDMNHAKTKIRFDIGDTENNSRSTKNKDGLFDSHSDLKEGCGAGAGDRIGTGTGIGLGVNSSRDQYKHEDTIPIGGMGVLSTRKLQKISS